MSDIITRADRIDQIIMAMAMYYEKEIPSEVVDLYHQLLADVSESDIAGACSVWMKKSRWFPRANDILEIIHKLKNANISIESRAQQQWRAVLSAVRRRGFQRGSPGFDDPITAILVERQFTWSYLCELQEIDEKWEQKRWCEAFELASEIEDDQLRIDTDSKIKLLVEPIGKIEN